MVSIQLTEEPARKLSKTPSKLLEQLQNKGYYSFYPGETWTPNVNLYETDASYMVCVDLAGVEKKKIDINIADGRLTIRGSRPVPSCKQTSNESARVRIHLMEIDHGGFARDVEMPQDVQADQITAKYENGMLWIELPKKP
jgi:HSP20 family protein